MRLIIDGDACPHKEEIFKLAKKHDVEVILITSLAHYSEYKDCTYVVVDNLPQAADMAVINRTHSGDVVITQDYGLAAIVLQKGAHVISPRGRVYLEEKMDELLMQRHIAQKVRRGGGRVKGPSAYKKEDLNRLLNVLKSIF